MWRDFVDGLGVGREVAATGLYIIIRNLTKSFIYWLCLFIFRVARNKISYYGVKNIYLPL